jgi:hypothetical protein
MSYLVLSYESKDEEWNPVHLETGRNPALLLNMLPG